MLHIYTTDKQYFRNIYVGYSQLRILIWDRLATKTATKRSKEDIERLRREMMSNARQRDEERCARVAHHRAEVAREEHEAAAVAQREKTLLGERGSHERPFVQNMMLNHAERSSVEEQVRRQSHHVQRSHMFIDSHAFRK